MKSIVLLVHNTFSKRTFVSVAKSLTKQYEENMKKLCEACEDSGFCVQTMRLIWYFLRNYPRQGQSTLAPDSVLGTQLYVLVITELNLFHTFLNSFRNKETSGLITGKRGAQDKGLNF